MLKSAVLVVAMVLVGCQTHEFDGDYEAPTSADLPAPSEVPGVLPAEAVEVPATTELSAGPIYQLLVYGPLSYDVTALDPIQQLVVQQVMDKVEAVMGFPVFTTELDASRKTYGVINISGEGCEVGEGKAGFASWSLAKLRATICFEWSVDRHYTMATIQHELLHTLGILHDDDHTSIMYTRANISGEMKPHHIARIRAMAGLEM